jgi:hypothetical protein
MKPRRNVYNASIFIFLLLCLTNIYTQDASSWQKSATIAVNSIIDRSVAEDIRIITHPNGRNGRLAVSPKITVEGSGLSVHINISWEGFTNYITYTTIINFIFVEKGFVSCSVEYENSIIPMSGSTKSNLENYISKQLYPRIKKTIAEINEKSITTITTTTSTTINETLDVILMKNKDVLSGDLAIQTITIQTTYGDLNFEFDKMKKVIFDGNGPGIDVIVLANGDRVSGLIKNLNIKFILSSGNEIDIPKDKISEISITTL